MEVRNHVGEDVIPLGDGSRDAVGLGPANDDVAVSTSLSNHGRKLVRRGAPGDPGRGVDPFDSLIAGVQADDRLPLVEARLQREREGKDAGERRQPTLGSPALRTERLSQAGDSLRVHL